jgi:hypothetical protein
MSLSDSIKKLMEGDNLDDVELAALLLESDSMNTEEKKEFIDKFMQENSQEFSEKERKLINLWLGKGNNNQSIQKFKLWILKNR